MSEHPSRPHTAHTLSRRTTYNKSNRVTPLTLDKVLPVIENGRAIPNTVNTEDNNILENTHDTDNHDTASITMPTVPQTLSRAHSMANLHRPKSVDTGLHTHSIDMNNPTQNNIRLPTSPTPLLQSNGHAIYTPGQYHPIHHKVAKTIDASLNIILVTMTFPWITLVPLLQYCITIERRIMQLLETSALCIGGIGNALLIIVLVRIHSLDESASYQSTEVAYVLFAATFSLLALIHYLISVCTRDGAVNAKKFDIGLLHIFAIDIDELHVTEQQLQSCSWIYVLISFVPALIGALISNYFYTDSSYSLKCTNSTSNVWCDVNSNGKCCNIINDTTSDISTFIGVLAGNIATGYVFVQRIAIFILKHNKAPPTLQEIVQEVKRVPPQSPKSIVA